jgi:hypothetical protein
MTVRWVVSHLEELPDESRLKRALRGEAGQFDQKDHLIADVRDALLMISYFSSIGAMSGLKRTDQDKVLRGLPKTPRRPGDPEETIEFATKEELEMLFPKKKLMQRLKKRMLNK